MSILLYILAVITGIYGLAQGDPVSWGAGLITAAIVVLIEKVDKDV